MSDWPSLVDRLLGSRITILMYHSVNPAPDAYSVSPDAFSRHMRIVRDHYSVIALRRVPEYLGASHERRVVLTFDDAFDDFERYAYPAMRDVAVPATVFVPTAFMGQTNTWDRDTAGVTAKRVMSKQQLRGLSQDQLIDIGSHTVDHLSMRRLSRDEMAQQALQSRRALEDTLGRAVTMFSYPFGQRQDFSRAAEEILRETGYEIAVTTCWGTRNATHDVLRLRRIWLKEQDDSRTVRAKIDGAYDWIGVKESVGFALRSWTGRTVRRPDHRSALS